MAVSSLVINDPIVNFVGGLNIALDGTVVVTNAMLQGISYQINSGPMNAILNINTNANPITWSASLTSTDCPVVGNYLVTIYVGDNQGNFTSANRNFTRNP